MRTYFLVGVDIETENDVEAEVQTISNEILSGLQWEGVAGVKVSHIDYMAEDLQTLYSSCTDYTAPIECSAALANYVGELADAIGVELHEAEKPHGCTNLDRFTMTRKRG